MIELVPSMQEAKREWEAFRVRHTDRCPNLARRGLRLSPRTSRGSATPSLLNAWHSNRRSSFTPEPEACEHALGCVCRRTSRHMWTKAGVRGSDFWPPERRDCLCIAHLACSMRQWTRRYTLLCITIIYTQSKIFTVLRLAMLQYTMLHYTML